MAVVKHTSRILVAAALVLFGTSALPFEDGFEAQASTCWSGVEKVDALNDTQGAVLVSHGSMVCLDGATAKFDCQPDALGICKRETPPVPPDPPQPTCKVPPGFTVQEYTWEHMVGYGNSYPNGPSFLAPVGAFTTRTSFARQGLPVAGKIYTAKFVADAKAHNFKWLAAQAVPAAGYYTPNVAASATLTVSDCRGDVYTACKASGFESSLFYSPNALIPACRVTPGKTYYVSVHFAPPSLSATANTCKDGNDKCDINLKAQ